MIISAILWLLFCGLSSCFQKIYTRTSSTSPNNASIAKSISSKELVFLHDSSGRAFVLANPAVHKDTVIGKVQVLTKEYYQDIDLIDTNQNYRGKRAAQVRGKLHLYTTNSVAPRDDIQLPLNSFHRMDSFAFNETATRSGRIAGTIGILAGIVIAVVAANAMAHSISFGSMRLN